MNIFEMNNIRKDADICGGKLTKQSPVSEVFSAMVNGTSLDKYGKTGDTAVSYIKSLGERAQNGDGVAVAELNTLRRFTIETPVMEQIKALSIFGSYQALGWDETPEREIVKYTGERSRIQAASGDVVYPAISTETYTVPSFTISGGFANDYRKVALGDMSKENEALAQVKTDIHNRAYKAVFEKVCAAIEGAAGVKYVLEEDGLTKAGFDGALAKIRRWGKPTFVGDYALIAQMTPWAGYQGTINANTITGVSEKTMDELRQYGTLSMYNGCVLSEMVNPYDLYATKKGDNFGTLLDTSVGLLIPAGAKSPVATWTRGGLTSMSGSDVTSGKLMTRFDLEIAVDVAKGQEYMLGLVKDNSLV